MGRTGKQLLMLWAVTIACMAAAAVLVVNLPHPSRAPCVGPPARATMDHLARCDHGVQLSASSTDRGNGHDLGFINDGQIGPHVEKWASAEGDGERTATIAWAQPVTISSIKVHHAGVREDSGFTTKEFTLAARVSGAWTELAHVKNNKANVTAHAFAPVTADAVRIQVLLGAVNGDPRARIFEIEVR